MCQSREQPAPYLLLFKYKAKDQGHQTVANRKNRDHFKTNPTAYAPQYGGYCAFGVAMGKKFDTDPNAWKVEGGKLYLNLDKTVQQRWLEDTSGFIEDADNNWATIKPVAADKL